jgi:plastocyanin
MRRILALLLVTPLLANCSDSPMPVAPGGTVLMNEESALQGPSSSAVMVFGNPDAGTPYPPQTHDQSLHGKDRVIPGTVVIEAGGTVTFEVTTRAHRVAVYDQGVRPEDITVGPGPLVLDPTNRLAFQSTPTPTFSYTFTKPGRYLVICAATRHFVVANMWGWVIVK